MGVIRVSPRKGHIRIHELSQELQNQIGYIYEGDISSEEWILNSEGIYEYDIQFFLNCEYIYYYNNPWIQIMNLEGTSGGYQIILGYELDNNDKILKLYSDENISLDFILRYIIREQNL